MEKPDKMRVAQALGAAFGFEPTSTAVQRLDDMDYSKVQVFYSDEFPLVYVIGEDGAWTFTVEFAQDGTGDIEAYAAGKVLHRDVIAAITKANINLHGFIVGGMRMFVLNPDYDADDRHLVRQLMDKVEALQGRPQRTQA